MWNIEKIDKGQLQDVVSIIQNAYFMQLKRLEITKEKWPDYIAFKTRENLEEEIRDEDFYILYEGKHPIGTVCVDHSLCVFKKGYIKWLAVVEQFQEKGYGTKLMNFAEALLFDKGATCIELCVISGDGRMNDFAMHRGYEITHQVSSLNLPFDITYFQLKMNKFKARHTKYEQIG